MDDIIGLWILFFPAILWTVKHSQSTHREVFQHHIHRILSVALNLATDHYALATHNSVKPTKTKY